MNNLRINGSLLSGTHTPLGIVNFKLSRLIAHQRGRAPMLPLHERNQTNTGRDGGTCMTRLSSR